MAACLGYCKGKGQNKEGHSCPFAYDHKIRGLSSPLYGLSEQH